MRRLTLQEAAQALGLTPAELEKRAGDGNVPGTLLSAGGWAFPAVVINHMAARSTGTSMGSRLHEGLHGVPTNPGSG